MTVNGAARGRMMADINVARELERIKVQQEHHADVLSGVSSAIVKIAETNQKLVAIDEKMLDVRSRLDSMDLRIDDNRAILLKWSGALTIVVFLMGFARYFM